MFKFCYRFKIIAKDDPAQQDIIYASNQYKSKTGIKDNAVLNVNSASTLDIKDILGESRFLGFLHATYYNNTRLKRFSD